jgi:hypothetical protein
VSSQRFPAAGRLLAVLALFAFAAPAARAQDKPLDAAALKRVKAATVSLRVQLQDGRTATGSGFLTDEPGLVVTNAHVLNMLDPDSRKPVKVEVTVLSGTDKSKTLTGTVVGVDRNGDLGLVRIDPKDLPAALALGTADALKETDNVYVFGFPFGDNLGKEITVSKATVSSLRKSPNGTLNRVQLQGGLNPGNSGGPVVDSNGNVIGVAVSGVRGTQIGFAIPADHVGPFLEGRIVESGVGQVYKDGDKQFLPLNLAFVDPLARVKKVELELWIGKPGPPRPASGAKEPAPTPGDTAKTRIELKYDSVTATAKLDVPVPALPAGQAYWYRPIVTNTRGAKWVVALTVPPQYPLERRAVALVYKPPVGGKQTAEMTSQGGFRVRNEDGEENSIAIDFRTRFTESFAQPERKGFPVQLTYNQFLLGLKMNDKPLPGDANIRKGLADMRFVTADLQMDADGGVGSARANLSRVPKESLAMWDDLSDQVLGSIEALSIPLPGKKVTATETWKARRELVIGSAVLAVPVQADLTYELLGVRTVDKQEYAMIAIGGTVRGRRGNGLDVGGNVNGTALVSMETGEVMIGRIGVKADVDVKFGGKSSKAIGTLNVSIRRPAPPLPPEKK